MDQQHAQFIDDEALARYLQDHDDSYVSEEYESEEETSEQLFCQNDIELPPPEQNSLNP
jgi:hypothetical protein